jgi:hypothetical protein
MAIASVTPTTMAPRRAIEINFINATQPMVENRWHAIQRVAPVSAPCRNLHRGLDNQLHRTGEVQPLNTH